MNKPNEPTGMTDQMVTDQMRRDLARQLRRVEPVQFVVIDGIMHYVALKADPNGEFCDLCGRPLVGMQHTICLECHLERITTKSGNDSTGQEN